MNIWFELVEDLKEEIRERQKELEEYRYPDDVLHELVDSFIPIYNSDLLEIIKGNIEVCYPEDEGLYSNEIDIFKRIQTGIYEQLIPIAYEALEQNITRG